MLKSCCHRIPTKEILFWVGFFFFFFFFFEGSGDGGGGNFLRTVENSESLKLRLTTFPNCLKLETRPPNLSFSTLSQSTSLDAVAVCLLTTACFIVAELANIINSVSLASENQSPLQFSRL